MERCETTEDVGRLDGRRVAVVGTYVQMDARMLPEPPPEYEGHAAVRLADGGEVWLEPSWSDAAIRPAEERERFTGREVEVVGLLHAEAPEAPEPVAQIVSPCLSPVEEVRPR